MIHLPAGHQPITLSPAQTRDIIVFLIDIHGLLDHLTRHDHTPGLATQVEHYLHLTGSDHTLPSMLNQLHTLITQLTQTMHDAVLHGDAPDQR